jgi:hypothetical protein
MSKSDFLENAMLELLLNAQAIANIADNAGSAPLTDLYLSLHTGDPQDSGNQGSAETTYTGYVRMPINRTGSGWNITANQASPAADVLFGSVSAGTGTITYVGVGADVSGAGRLLYSGSLSPPIVLGVGVEPQITTGSIIQED